MDDGVDGAAPPPPSVVRAGVFGDDANDAVSIGGGGSGKTNPTPLSWSGGDGDLWRAREKIQLLAVRCFWAVAAS